MKRQICAVRGNYSCYESQTCAVEGACLPYEVNICCERRICGVEGDCLSWKADMCLKGQLFVVRRWICVVRGDYLS